MVVTSELSQPGKARGCHLFPEEEKVTKQCSTPRQRFHGTRSDASIENEKLRKEVDDLRAAAESDLNPGTIDYERYRLTKAQADAQELKNAEREGLVLETELFTYILQRVAQEIAGILSRVPLVLQRKYPDLCQSHIDVVRTEIARASGRAATIADVEKWTDDFRRAQGE